jgi:predicted permease
MNATLGAVVPVFLDILLGLALRQRSVLPDAFWAPAEKLTYFIWPGVGIGHPVMRRTWR